jgi:hypothetical protein
MFHRSVSFTTPPSLAGLDAETLATVLCVELVRVVEHVEHEHLSRLASLAMAGEA